MEKILIKKLNDSAILPVRSTSGSAGADLFACLDEPVRIAPGKTALIPTGISIQLESRFYAAMVYARSGLAIKHGICLANGVGVIDSDYTGEIKVGLLNAGEDEYTVLPGERIAQLVVHPVALPEIVETSSIHKTERGDGGFGSTGKM